MFKRFWNYLKTLFRVKAESRHGSRDRDRAGDLGGP